MKKSPFHLAIPLIIGLIFSGISLKHKTTPVPVVSANITTEVIVEKPDPEPIPIITKSVEPQPILAPTPIPKRVPTPKSQPKKVNTPPPAPKPTPLPTPVPVPAHANCTTGNFNDQFLCLINNYRVSKNLNRLSFENELNLAATGHSTWMNTNKTMNHIGLDGSTFTQRCQQSGTTCDGENIAYGYRTAEKLFNAWKNSSGHNANMLGQHTVMGLSLVGIYATLDLR